MAKLQLNVVRAMFATLSILGASSAYTQTIEIVDSGVIGDGQVGRPITFRAVADGCTPDPVGWNWTATEEPAVVGAFRSEATFTWVRTETSPVVTVTNSACGSASDSKQVVLFQAVPLRPLSVARRPQGMIRGTRETDSLTLVYTPAFGSSDTILELAGDPVPLDLDSATILVPAGRATTVPLRFPSAVVEAATGGILSTNLVITGPILGGSAELARIPVHMLLPENGSTSSPRAATRMDFASDSSRDRYEARITYSNDGPGRLQALVTSSVDWIDLGDMPLLILEPGESGDVTFSIDRTKRPDAQAPLGTASSDVALLFPSSPAKSRTTSSSTAASLATAVTDTVELPTAGLAIPPLGDGEVALFLPGVGHVQGSVGLFVSDVSITNTSKDAPVRNVRMYYQPAGGTESVETVAPAITRDTAVSLADVVKQTFGVQGQVGTLQLRTRLPDSVAAVANVFNSSNPAGTYGTAIPPFRSDRSTGPGETTHITGLRKTATSHTNVFLQEVAGAPADVSVTFLDSTGTPLGSTTFALGPFSLIQRSDVAPAGSTSVEITVDPASSGRLISFATPVDRASGDTWTLTDWRRFYSYPGDEEVIVPVAGAVRGANQTYFRTDVAIMNTGTATANAILSYFGRAGERVTRTVDIDPGESRILDDVVGGYLGIANDSVGAIFVSPSPDADLLVTSRTYTTVEGEAGTFGTGVPTLSLADALQPGDERRFGGLDDAAFTTIAAATPASFRTNFGIVETSGSSARIRATVRYALQASMISTAATLVEGAKEYQLAPNQLLLLSNVAREILGDARESTLGDLRNLQVEFEMLEGRAHVFVTSTDNGTGDSILRTE